MKDDRDIQDLLDSLRDSKLLSAEEMDRAAKSSTSAVNCTSFAQSLISTGVLTSYQMETVCKRKFEELRMGNYEVLDRIGHMISSSDVAISRDVFDHSQASADGAKTDAW